LNKIRIHQESNDAEFQVLKSSHANLGEWVQSQRADLSEASHKMANLRHECTTTQGALAKDIAILAEELRAVGCFVPFL
jgi:hypothetical protein